MPAQEARPILFHGIDVDGAEEFPFRAQCRHIKGDDHVLAEHGRIVGGEVRPFDLPAPDAVAYAGKRWESGMPRFAASFTTAPWISEQATPGRSMSSASI